MSIANKVTPSPGGGKVRKNKKGPVRIYVAGPISKGNQFLNCVKGIQVADQLLQMGYVPFCPHLSYFWHHISGRPPTYGEWLKYDFQWVKLCHAVLRIPGESLGADREVAFAKEHKIPVFYSVKELKRRIPCRTSTKDIAKS